MGSQTSPRGRGLEVLHAAEDGLRKILADASLTANYAELRELAAWAEAVGRISRGLPPEVAKRSKAARRGKGGPRRGRRKRTSRGYPRFARQGQDLVKVGWSRKKRAEYQQTVERGALSALLDRIQAVPRGGRFTMEELQPVPRSHGAGDIPVYQLYICLAWLRDAGLVVQHGRQGYSLAEVTDLRGAVEERWSQLAASRGSGEEKG